MPRDIKHLTKDLEVHLQDAVAETAANISYTLQHVGPWWTGSFGENWEISTTRVKPTKPRTGGIESPTTRLPMRKATAPRPLGTPMFIGNSIFYAGFVINRPGATRPDEMGRQVTYQGHLHGDIPHNSTVEMPFSAKYNWFNIYLKHPTYMQDDFNAGFMMAGFKINPGTPKRFYK